MLVQLIQEFGRVKSLRKVLNTQSFKWYPEKKISLTIYITTIAYMVMLSVISQGLQIYIRALFNCGFLLCEKESLHIFCKNLQQ